MANLMSSTPRSAVAAPAIRTDVGRSSPVKIWAVVGGAFLLLEAYVLVRWIAVGQATSTPVGPVAVPTTMKATAILLQVLSVLGTVWALIAVVFRPWRRDGRLSADGLLALAFLPLFWQDALLNFTQNWFVYNSGMPNLGSWYTNVPGWLAPNTNRVPMPVFFTYGSYLWLGVAFTAVANWLMRRAKARWPGIGAVGLIAVASACGALCDLVAELVFIRVGGLWAYAGAIPSLSLFPGRYYQFPLYSPVLFGVTLGLWAALRYYRDDRGRTLVERGTERLRTGPRRQTFLRYLALSGALNIIFLVGYNVPIQLFALHAAPWPQDILDRPYFTNGICGPGTTYECSSPNVPIPRDNSQHVDPQGQLRPEGTN